MQRRAGARSIEEITQGPAAEFLVPLWWSQLLHVLVQVSANDLTTVSGDHLMVSGVWVYTSRIDRVDMVNTLGPRQIGHHFPDVIFKCIFLNENI